MGKREKRIKVHRKMEAGFAFSYQRRYSEI
jgi:hypothetical protein